MVIVFNVEEEACTREEEDKFGVVQGRIESVSDVADLAVSEHLS